MSIFNHKYLRYIVLVPLLVMLLATGYFAWVTSEINTTLLAEKRLEKQLEIDLIADQIDDFIEADEDWYTYAYEPIITKRLASLDAQPFTFAALYDSSLNNVSARTPSYNSFFEPVDHLGFVDEVRRNASGHSILSYEPDGEEARDMYIYYRWIPTDSTLQGRYLAVVAVSNYSVTNRISDWVGIGAMGLIIVVTALNVILAILLTRLGHIYEQRNGGKHRRAL